MEKLNIYELKYYNSEYLEIISSLHMIAFPSFFLSQLGKPFLKTLYSCYVEDKKSGIIVAESNNKIEGFIAYSNDYPQFFKNLIEKHLLRFAFYSLTAAIKHPSFIKRLLGAFSKSESVVKENKYVELASICVNPDLEGKGIGTQLIDYLKGIVDFRTYAYINLETDAVNNEKVNQFYIKNGFLLIRKFSTKEGRLMNEYRFSPGVKK